MGTGERPVREEALAAQLGATTPGTVTLGRNLRWTRVDSSIDSASRILIGSRSRPDNPGVGGGAGSPARAPRDPPVSICLLALLLLAWDRDPAPASGRGRPARPGGSARNVGGTAGRERADRPAQASRRRLHSRTAASSVLRGGGWRRPRRIDSAVRSGQHTCSHGLLLEGSALARQQRHHQPGGAWTAGAMGSRAWRPGEHFGTDGSRSTPSAPRRPSRLDRGRMTRATTSSPSASPTRFPRPSTRWSRAARCGPAARPRPGSFRAASRRTRSTWTRSGASAKRSRGCGKTFSA